MTTVLQRRQRQPSKKASTIAPNVLQLPEENFFLVVGTGSVSNVKLFLKRHTKDGEFDFNINRVNFNNMSAMSIAVESGDWEMVKYLLTVMDISWREVLLKAIHAGDIELVMSLCEEADVDATQSPVAEDEYSLNMTPLMLAAIEGRYDIVGYLISRGHSIPVPHSPSCLCEDTCSPRRATCDKLDLALFTFWQYSAMCSPQYFVYITGDPIYYAFQIHKRVMDLSGVERPFKLRYEQLAQNLRQFAADLVGECANTSEIETVLNKRCSVHGCMEGIMPQVVYPRLLMAIEYNQKEFVTHPKVQLLLRDRFYGEFDDWKYYSNMTKVFYPIVRLWTFPSALFSIVLYPSSSEAKFYASPINRMLHSLIFYLLFLGALLLENLRDKPRQLEPNMSSIGTLIICVYVCSYTASIVHEILCFRPARFFQNGWNIFDIVTLTMFGFYLAFTVASLCHYVQSRSHNQERKYWARTEPQLIAEGFLVIATILAFLKLLFYWQAHTVMGPLQVTLGQIIVASARYSFFVVIILLSYCTAFSNLYSYYEGMTYRDPRSRDAAFQEQSFVSWMSSCKTFFWAMFSQLDPAVADVVVDNLNKTSQVPDHIFTQFVGYVGLGTFSLLVVMVVVNMLIAAISETFANMLNDVHKSWLFARTEMYVYFMTYPVLSPPFNLIPNLYRVRNVQDKSDLEQGQTAEGPTCQLDEYSSVVGLLVQRYFCTLRRRQDRQIGNTMARNNNFVHQMSQSVL